jgi:hypothetical protein
MKRLFVFCLCFGLFAFASSAQQEQTPAVASRTLSPDGSLAVFKLMLPMLAENYAGDLPGSLVLHDLVNGTATVLSGQPEEFVCDPTMGCRNTLTQGAAVFSPDGSQIAWTERAEPEGSFIVTLAVHTIETGETVRFPETVSLGFQDAGLMMPSLQWGEGRLLHLYSTNMSDSNFHRLVQVIDPASGGNVTLDLHTQNVDEDDRLPVRAEWAEWSGKIVIGVSDQLGRWRVIDVAAGTDTPTSETPRALVYRVGADEPHVALTSVYDPESFFFRLSLDPDADVQQDLMDVAFITNDEQRFLALEAAERLLEPFAAQLIEMGEAESITDSSLIYDYWSGPADAPVIRWTFDSAPDGVSQPLRLAPHGS